MPKKYIKPFAEINHLTGKDILTESAAVAITSSDNTTSVSGELPPVKI